jgi:hypothetical protein
MDCLKFMQNKPLTIQAGLAPVLDKQEAPGKITRGQNKEKTKKTVFFCFNYNLIPHCSKSRHNKKNTG